MNNFKLLFKQYGFLKNKNENDENFSANLIQYGISEEYYDKVQSATDLLLKFYNSKMSSISLQKAVAHRLNVTHDDLMKFCLLIDVYRCYNGLSHPTSSTTPEGIAILILMGKVLGIGAIKSYDQLGQVSTITLSLTDLLPYIGECSESIGSNYSLFLPTVFAKKRPEHITAYRKLIYHLCKTIAEVDGEISIAETEWLNEIALQNDDNSDNDIDISDL